MKQITKVTAYKVYDNDGKCIGYYREDEKELAEQWIKINGGRYVKAIFLLNK